MEIRFSSEVYSEIMSEYNKNTSGWTLIKSPAKSGFRNEIYIGQGGVWQLKMALLSGGKEMGVGAKIDFDSEKYKGPITNFGFRPISAEDLKAVYRHAVESPGGSLQVPEDVFDTLASRNPVSTSSIESSGEPAYSEGPFIKDRKEFVLGKAQAELDEMLDLELRRMRKNGF